MADTPTGQRGQYVKRKAAQKRVSEVASTLHPRTVEETAAVWEWHNRMLRVTKCVR